MREGGSKEGEMDVGSGLSVKTSVNDNALIGNAEAICK